jgi:DNA-binding SARP family transcriptional activator
MDTGPELSISLLPTCVLSRAGGEVVVPLRVQRLLALLALSHDRPLTRAHVAGSLWPDTTSSRAFSSLRSTLRGLRSLDPLVRVDVESVRLSPGVHVDWVEAVGHARRILDGDTRVPALRAVQLLRRGLLTDWCEEWLDAEQHSFLQLRVHALETLCLQLSQDGRHALAVEAGLAAVACEPLRESAHRALIRAHLAEGNHFDAMAQFRRFERDLRTELGLSPGPGVTRLLPGYSPVTAPS